MGKIGDEPVDTAIGMLSGESCWGGNAFSANMVGSGYMLLEAAIVFVILGYPRMPRDPRIGVENLPSVTNVALKLSACLYRQEYDNLAGQAVAAEFEQVHKSQTLDSDVGGISDCALVFDKSPLARDESTKDVEGLEHGPVLSFKELE